MGGRLWAAGGAIRYEPAALVVHEVVVDRFERRWILRRGLAQGLTNARLAALDGPLSVRAPSRRPCREDARFARRRSPPSLQVVLQPADVRRATCSTTSPAARHV